SRNACVAVGAASQKTTSTYTAHFQTLYTFNGQIWQAHHLKELRYGGLNAVACTSTVSCIAVGSYEVGHHVDGPIAYTNAPPGGARADRPVRSARSAAAVG